MRSRGVRQIGVRVAGGGVVPMLDLRRSREARMVFTTVADGQRAADFELCGRRGRLGRWTTLCTLRLEPLAPQPAGQPDLSFRLAVDPRGELVTELSGSSAEGRSLRHRIPLAAVGASVPRVREMGDWQRVERVQPGGPVAEGQGERRAPARGQAGARRQAIARRQAPAQKPRGRTPLKRSARRWPAVVAVLLGALLVAALAAGRLLLHRPAAAPTGAPETTPQVSGAETPAPSVQQPAPQIAEPRAPEPPVEQKPQAQGATGSQMTGAASPAEESPYRVVWGDTLWRIAERFYGDRELYRELARRNRLADPNRIVAGQVITLPAQLGGRRVLEPGALTGSR